MGLYADNDGRLPCEAKLKTIGPPSTQEIIKDLHGAAAVGVGTEYAAAVGWIRGITNASKYGRYAGLNDAESLAEIVRVLDAVDHVVGELAADASELRLS